MFTKSTKILIVISVVAVALLSLSAVAFHPASVSVANDSAAKQRVGEQSAGVGPEQAYLNQRYGEWAAGQSIYADRSYDSVEGVRSDRTNFLIADRSYDDIENLRAQRFFQ